MRTTIEINPDHRAKLLALAARRGDKGFSSIVAEALEAYLETAAASEGLRPRALQLEGTLTKSQAARLRRVTRALRKSWR